MLKVELHAIESYGVLTLSHMGHMAFPSWLVLLLNICFFLGNCKACQGPDDLYTTLFYLFFF